MTLNLRDLRFDGKPHGMGVEKGKKPEGISGLVMIFYGKVVLPMMGDDIKNKKLVSQ